MYKRNIDVFIYMYLISFQNNYVYRTNNIFLKLSKWFLKMISDVPELTADIFCKLKLVVEFNM